MAPQLNQAWYWSIRADDGVMGASSGNRRIALALLALVGGVVAVHVHSVQVHGIKPTPRPGLSARATPVGAKHQDGKGARHGTQSRRIRNLIEQP